MFFRIRLNICPLCFWNVNDKKQLAGVDYSGPRGIEKQHTLHVVHTLLKGLFLQLTPEDIGNPDEKHYVLLGL